MATSNSPQRDNCSRLGAGLRVRHCELQLDRQNHSQARAPHNAAARTKVSLVLNSKALSQSSPPPHSPQNRVHFAGRAKKQLASVALRAKDGFPLQTGAIVAVREVNEQVPLPPVRLSTMNQNDNGADRRRQRGLSLKSCTVHLFVYQAQECLNKCQPASKAGQMVRAKTYTGGSANGPKEGLHNVKLN